jgi:hypothetical protein
MDQRNVAKFSIQDSPTLLYRTAYLMEQHRSKTMHLLKQHIGAHNMNSLSISNFKE